jgi:nitronate monooxygenase
MAGLIHDIPTCQELLDSIMVEAEALISERLSGMMA